MKFTYNNDKSDLKNLKYYGDIQFGVLYRYKGKVVIRVYHDKYIMLVDLSAPQNTWKRGKSVMCSVTPLDPGESITLTQE